MTNRERVSATVSSARLGRWEISTCVFLSFHDDRYLTPCKAGRATAPPANQWRGTDLLRSAPFRAPKVLLGVELNDQLLGDLGVDLRPLRHLVHQDAQPVRDDLQPRRHRPVTLGLLGNDERIHAHRLGSDVDDVVPGHPEAGDVHLLAVHGEVPVVDQLAGHPPGTGQTGPVYDVVQPGLEDLQQVVTGLAGTPAGFLVVAAELLLQHAVGEARLLLLLGLQQVLGLLDPDPAVLAGRIRAALERLVAADKVNLEPTGLAGHGAGVTSHNWFSLP